MYFPLDSLSMIGINKYQQERNRRKKLSVLLLASLLILTFAGCGSSGGSDDDDDDATWPVEYYMSVGGSPAPLMKAAPTTGTLTRTGEGTYSGGDPHNNVTLSLTGSWDNVDNALSGENVTISSGSLTIKGNTFAKDGSNTTPTPTVTWPVIYRAENPEVPGSYLYLVFKEDGTFAASEGTVENVLGGGTYSGLDPHTDGFIKMSGNLGETPILEANYEIVDGVLTCLTNWERQ